MSEADDLPALVGDNARTPRRLAFFRQLSEREREVKTDAEREADRLAATILELTQLNQNGSTVPSDETSNVSAPFEEVSGASVGAFPPSLINLLQDFDSISDTSALPHAIAELVSVCQERNNRLEEAEDSMKRLEEVTRNLLLLQQQQYEEMTNQNNQPRRLQQSPDGGANTNTTTNPDTESTTPVPISRQSSNANTNPDPDSEQSNVGPISTRSSHGSDPPASPREPSSSRHNANRAAEDPPDATAHLLRAQSLPLLMTGLDWSTYYDRKRDCPDPPAMKAEEHERKMTFNEMHKIEDAIQEGPGKQQEVQSSERPTGAIPNQVSSRETSSDLLPANSEPFALDTNSLMAQAIVEEVLKKLKPPPSSSVSNDTATERKRAPEQSGRLQSQDQNTQDRLAWQVIVQDAAEKMISGGLLQSKLSATIPKDWTIERLRPPKMTHSEAPPSETEAEIVAVIEGNKADSADPPGASEKLEERKCEFVRRTSMEPPELHQKMPAKHTSSTESHQKMTTVHSTSPDSDPISNSGNGPTEVVGENGTARPVGAFRVRPGGPASSTDDPPQMAKQERGIYRHNSFDQSTLLLPDTTLPSSGREVTPSSGREVLPNSVREEFDTRALSSAARTDESDQAVMDRRVVDNQRNTAIYPLPPAVINLQQEDMSFRAQEIPRTEVELPSSVREELISSGPEDDIDLAVTASLVADEPTDIRRLAQEIVHLQEEMTNREQEIPTAEVVKTSCCIIQ